MEDMLWPSCEEHPLLCETHSLTKQDLNDKVVEVLKIVDGKMRTGGEALEAGRAAAGVSGLAPPAPTDVRVMCRFKHDGMCRSLKLQNLRLMLSTSATFGPADWRDTAAYQHMHIDTPGKLASMSEAAVRLLSGQENVDGCQLARAEDLYEIPF